MRTSNFSLFLGAIDALEITDMEKLIAVQGFRLMLSPSEWKLVKNEYEEFISTLEVEE